MTKTRWSYLVIALLAAAAVGCSDGARRLSPIGPSPVADVAATATETAASWATTHGWSTMADGRVAVADGVAVEATEVVSNVAGACPSRTITVRGVPVAVTASTSYAAPLSCEALTSGTVVKITGVLMHSMGGFSVTATHLAAMPAANNSPAPSGGEKLSGEGIVGAVSGGCPSRTFMMLGYRLHTTASTAYGAGSSCEGVREGLMVHLDVTKQADGTIYVDRLEFLNAPGQRQ